MKDNMKNNLVYRCLSCLWRSTILKWYRDHRKRKEEAYWAEHEKRCGREHPDKTFYVIRRRDLYCGLFSLFITNLKRIDDAVKQGYIPVIDMQNDFNIYLAEDKVGKENAWEYYFKQPMEYSLEDIGKSRHVIIGSGAVPPMFPYLDIKFLTGESGELAYWRKQVRKYITLSDEAQRMVEKEYNRLFVREDKVLGVKCRGTDYTNGKPRNHPVQPTPQQAVSKALEIFEAQGCTKVFLATEDAAFYEIFRQKFGSRLITNKIDYMVYQGGSTGKEEYEQKNGGYQAGMEYLITTMLLARCQCLCAGCVSATVGALLLTEGYEYVYLFDLGIYE